MLAEIFAHLSESKALAMGCWRADGKFTAANEAFLGLIDCSQEEVLTGKVGWPDLTPPEYAALDNVALQEIRSRGVCSPFEKEYVRKDGSRVPVLIVATAYSTETSDAGAFYVVDLSKRKKCSLDELAATTEIGAMTDRQRLICFLLSVGESEKHIAATLDVGLRTVENDKYHVAKQLTIPTAHVLIWAVENRQAILRAIENKSAIPNRFCGQTAGRLTL